MRPSSEAGPSGRVTWWAMDRDLEIVERGEAAEADAYRIVDDYFARLKPRYESGEEAMAETSFGFQRGKDGDGEFIEFCLNGPQEISLNYEKATPGRFLFWAMADVLQEERTLRSREAVKDVVTAFYTLESRDFVAWLQREIAED